MGKSLHGPVHRLGLAALLLASAACVSTDGAVTLARCIGRSADRLAATGAEELRATCALGRRGNGTVVAFPDAPVAGVDLEAQGLSAAHIRQIDLLQMTDRPYQRLNVLRTGPGERSSRTTSHRRFVETPGLLVCRAPDAEIDIVLRRRGETIELVGLE